MLTLERLLAERQALEDEVVAALHNGTEEAATSALKKAAHHYIDAVKLAINPTPRPLVFVAVFVLGLLRGCLIQAAPDAERAAADLAELWDVTATTVELPRFRKEDGNVE